MKRKNKFLISAILLLTITFLIFQSPTQKEIINTSFVAGENPAFDLTPGILSFGKIVPGSFSKRNITITNTYSYPTITNVKSSGAISEHLIVSENNFRLNPNESKNLTFSCYPSEGIELKEYQGKITIETLKA